MKWIKLFESYKTEKASKMIDIKNRLEKEMIDLQDEISSDVFSYMYDIVDNYKISDVNIGIDDDDNYDVSGIVMTMTISSKLTNLDTLMEDLETASNRIHDSLGMSIGIRVLGDNYIRKIDWKNDPFYFNGDRFSGEKKRILFNVVRRIKESLNSRDYDEYYIGIIVS